MNDLQDLFFDSEGFLGISNDFWLNVISELFVGVLIIGSISFILTRYTKSMEDRMRRYERSSKALRLYHHYSSALMAWSSCADRLSQALVHIIKNRDEPFPAVLNAQMASVQASIDQIEDERKNIRQWFEDHYDVYPVSQHKAIHDFQGGAESFCNAMGTYVLIFQRILMADRDLIKLGGLFVESESLLAGLDSFLISTRRYPELHTAAFAEYILDTRVMKNSAMAILRVNERHEAFANAIKAFAGHVTNNYRKSVRAAGLDR